MLSVGDFLGRALPWPDETSPGYCNVHWKTPPKDGGKPIWMGKPAKDPLEMLSTVRWAAETFPRPDIYMCLSRQAKAGRSKSGKVKAERSAALATGVKAIWLDIDVKQPPQGYETLPEAMEALRAFVKATGLPAPSALVTSGGGLQVYWISRTVLTVEDWRPYANGLRALAVQHGLRCDGGCTIDVARILRVPGTFNWKLPHGRPVRLVGLEKDYDFETDLILLHAVAPLAQQATPAAVVCLIPLGEKPDQAFLGQQLGDLGNPDDRPNLTLDPIPIINQCAFLKTAFTTGGKDYDNPLWNLTTLCSTFLEDGRKFAHRMAAGHPGYTPASTDALFDRKVRERAEKGLGYPACRTVHSNGYAGCATCPLYPLGKSPLNIRPRAKATRAHHGRGPVITAAVKDDEVPGTIDLPDGYGYNDDGIICLLSYVSQKGKKDAPEELIHLPLFMCQLTYAWSQKKQDSINFTTTVSKDETRDCSLPMHVCQVGGDALYRLCGEMGVKLDPDNKRHVGKFFMALLTKLHNAKQSADTVPFGWWPSNTDRQGFCFGGKLFKQDGRVTRCGFIDPELRRDRTPTGDDRAWIAACKIVADMKRPELDMMLAIPFAAPLVAMIFEMGHCTYSCWNNEGGAAKTTAMLIGLSVWGRPKKCKEVKTSTSLGVMRKMGMLNSIPTGWDEISDDHAYEAFHRVAYQTDGRESTRLKSTGGDIHFQSVGEWQTIIMGAANKSMHDYAVKKNPSSAAPLLRVFEYETAKIDTGVLENTTEMSVVLQALETNYGVVGLAYAAMLGKHHKKIEKMLLAEDKRFSKLIKAQPEERFWKTLCTTCLVGARLANQFGAQIDMDQLEDWMVMTFEANRRGIIERGLKGSGADRTLSMLNRFLVDYGNQTLWLDRFHTGRGRPVEPTALHGPVMDRDTARILVQYSVNDRHLRFNREVCDKWLRQNEYPERPFYSGLQKLFPGARMNQRVTLARGTSYLRGVASLTVELPIRVGGDLWENLMLYSAEAKEKAENPCAEKTSSEITVGP